MFSFALNRYPEDPRLARHAAGAPPAAHLHPAGGLDRPLRRPAGRGAHGRGAGHLRAHRLRHLTGRGHAAGAGDHADPRVARFCAWEGALLYFIIIIICIIH